MTRSSIDYAKQPAASRRRTLRFAATPAHHAGDVAARWRHDQRAVVFAKTALILNIRAHVDHGGGYHTTADTSAVVPMPGLEASSRAFASIIDQANRLSREELAT